MKQNKTKAGMQSEIDAALEKNQEMEHITNFIQENLNIANENKPKQMTLLERMAELEAQTPANKNQLTAEESELIRKLVDKSTITKVQFADKLGLKVNTFAYKLKCSTLSTEEAETILNAIAEGQER